MISKLLDKLTTDFVVGFFLGVALLMALAMGTDTQFSTTLASGLVGFLGRSAIHIGGNKNDSN